MSPVAFPIIAAGEIPFLIGDVHGGIRAVDTWYRKYAPTEMKDVKYCFSFILDPATWHSRNKKIVVPADIKGMKIRPVERNDRHLGHATRRHQRAGERVGSARRAWRRALPRR